MTTFPSIVTLLSLLANPPIDTVADAQRSDPPKQAEERLESARQAAAEGRSAVVLKELEAGLRRPPPRGRSAYHYARLELWGLAWVDREVLRTLDEHGLEEAFERLDRASKPFSSEFARARLETLRERTKSMWASHIKDKNPAAAALRARMERRIDSAEQDLQRAEKYLDRASMASRKTVESAKNGKAALRRFLKAERNSKRWLRIKDLDAASEQELNALLEQAQAGAMKAMLRIANARTTQGSFREALTWVDRAQQRDPKNEELRELRRTIQVASAASSPWIGWGPVLPAGF